MTFTAEQLNDARKGGYSDDEIWSYLGEQDQGFAGAKEAGYSLDEVAGYFGGLTKPDVGTSVEQEVSQLGAALKSGIAQPLQAMGVTAETLGMPAVGAALKGATEQPEGYVSAAQRFMEPQAGEAQLGGFAFQYLPRAIVEQVGQLAGSVASRAAGGVIGGAAGSVVPGAGTAVGAGIGMFTGPALFEAAQIVGPVAKERAKNNGREIPNSEDLAYAWTTAGTSGALNAIGAKYLPGGEKAVGALTKRIAASFLGEGATEGAQALAQQTGETILTEKGLEIQPKAALGEALIGGVSAGGAAIVMSPLQKEQVDIEREADLESRDLSIPVDDPEVRANLDKANILEQENKDSLAIINKFGVESEEGKAAQQTIVDNTDEITKLNETLPTGLSLPITTAEQQQIELAKQIAAPAEEVAPNIEIKEVENGFQVLVNGTPESDTIWATREAASRVAKSEYEYELRKANKKPIRAVSEMIISTSPDGDVIYDPKNNLEFNEIVSIKGAITASKENVELPYKDYYKQGNVYRHIDDPRFKVSDVDEEGIVKLAEKETLKLQNKDNIPAINKIEQHMGAFSNPQAATQALDQNAESLKPIQEAHRSLLRQKYGDVVTVYRGVDPNFIPAPDRNVSSWSLTKVGAERHAGGEGRVVITKTVKVDDIQFVSNWRETEVLLRDDAKDVATTPAPPVAEAPAITPAPVAETPAVSPAPEVAPAPAKLTLWRAERNVGDIKEGPSLGTFLTNSEQTANSLADLKGNVERIDVEINKPLTIPSGPENAELYFSSEDVNKLLADAGVKYKVWSGYPMDEFWRILDAEGKKMLNAIKKAGYDSIQYPEFLGGQNQTTTLLLQHEKEGQTFKSKITPTPAPAVSETITKPKLGEKGGVLIPSREDLIQAGQNIYEAGMEFGAWAKQMIQRFGDAVRQFLADVWEAVSGFPAKLEEMAGYLPGKGERGAVTFGRGEEPPKKPAEPTPVTPAEPVPEKPAAKPTGRVEQIMSQKIGPSIKTQDGIIAKTKDKLKTLFDPEVVNEANTSTAYRAIGILSGTNRDAARQYAESINALTAEGLGEDADTANEISMGAALFVNNLFEYAVKLAAKGDRKMLGLMVSNINKLPTGQMGASDAGRTLRARVELKARFLMMAQAEQDAFTNYVAEFIYGPNPTEAQIKSIKDAYSATQKVAQPTEEELTDEIAKVGEKTYTDLVSKINDDFTKAAEKDKDARDAELKELSDEYNKIQDKAETEIEKLAEIQSDTPSFARKKVNEIRAIVSADLKQRPDLGRKAPWKSMLIAKLQNAGVSPANAETLADLVWRQHEINATSRELESINKAIEKGPISEIIKQIKDTPIEQQQDPKWRYQVMRDYLRRAGLSMAQAERIAKLMDISLQKRFTEAKEKAFTESIEKSAPWKSGEVRSKRAFQQVIKAIRAGALDPSRNFLNDVAAANGWTGFTDSQYAKLIKLDSILSNPKSSDADKAEAHKAIQNIISNSKLPIRARDVIGQFYDAQALSGIPTITVNMVSPIGMAAKNALVQAASGVATFRPDQIDAAFRTLMDSIKSWANTVAYSFKNNVTVYSNVEYLVNDEGLLKLYNRGKEQFKKGKTPKDRADGVKNMMVGMWDYVRRILNALDYGAIASLQNQTVPKYALAAMQAKGMSSKDGTKMLNAMFEAKRNFYDQQIAAGVDKNKASVLADEFFVSSWRQALTDAKLPAQQVIDSAINDAMSAVGRTRASLDNFRDENTNLQDAGVTSLPALWLLQSMANAANKSDSQLIKIFARIIYGFAVVPARVFRETAWFSPYGYVRFAYDAIAKKKGLNSPYAQSLGNDLQYRQRINEATAGTLVMLGLASALVSSIDDEDDERPFKIVVTGNGPNRADDPQFYDSWIKNNTPNSVRIQFGKTKFTINTMRGFEAFAWPAMMLGAVDDWQIRRKMNRKQNEPVAVGDAAIVAGNVFSAALKRGPYAFAAKPLFESYGDRTVESLFKSLAFPVKTLIPGVGSSLARNFSDLLNEPIDRRTLDGALWANVPFIGPAVAPKAMNAFGEPALAGEASDKLFKLGVPIVFKIGTDRDSVNIHNLVLKQGSGPSIPTRNQLAKRLDREPTNKEYELFVKEYGSFISEQMKKRYKRYDEMKPETYDKAIQKLSDVARDKAERVVRRQKKP